MRRPLSDLVINHVTGRLSHTKTWANVAYAVVTWIVIHQELHSKLSDEMIGIYLGVVALHTVSSKMVSIKGGTDTGEADAKS